MADTPSSLDLLALAVRVAEGGAALAQDAREQAITHVGTKSTDTDVVTAGDEEVERYILARAGRGPSRRRGAQRGVRRGGRRA